MKRSCGAADYDKIRAAAGVNHDDDYLTSAREMAVVWVMTVHAR